MAKARKAKIKRPGRRKSYLGRNIAFLTTALMVVLLLLSPSLYYYGYVSANDATALASIAISLILSFAALSYMLRKGDGVKKTINELGLSNDKFSLKMVVYGILLFVAYIGVVFLIGIIAYLANKQVNSNVSTVIGGYPLYALVFVAIIAPINEEIFFRGFAVPRIGVIISAILFAALHYSYGSYVEVFKALWFGICAGYLFKKTRSLYPSIVTHIMVNATTALLLLHTGMLISLVIR